MSSIALYDKVHELRPDLIPVLKSPDWFHTWSNAQDLFQPPWFRYPIFGDHPQYFAAGANRKNTDGAQRDFSEIPRLTPIQVEALDLLTSSCRATSSATRWSWNAVTCSYPTASSRSISRTTRIPMINVISCVSGSPSPHLNPFHRRSPSSGGISGRVWSVAASEGTRSLLSSSRMRKVRHGV